MYHTSCTFGSFSKEEKISPLTFIQITIFNWENLLFAIVKFKNISNYITLYYINLKNPFFLKKYFKNY